MKRLDGKVIIVTGAGTGIGEEVVKRCAREGARVVVAAHRQVSAERVVAAIKAEGGEAIGVFGDVSQEEVAQSVIARTIEAYGRIDVLHNNAAGTGGDVIGQDRAIDICDIEIWRRTMEVNVLGPVLLSKHAIPHMIAQGDGAIIMTSSGRAIEGDIGYPAYGASKAALVNVALNLATQYGKQGIRANALIVGMILTETLAGHMSERMKTMYASHHLVPFFGKPSDIADAVVFLASDEARFITGTTLKVDGGITAHTAPYADLLSPESAGDALV